MAYATTTQLQDHLSPDPAPANASRLLDRASRDVDRELKTAVYDVDADWAPTDPKVIDALREATLEQVSWRLSQGDSDGLGVVQAYTSVGIGSVTLSRGGGTASSGGAMDLCGQARQILDDAQLLNFEPWTW